MDLKRRKQVESPNSGRGSSSSNSPTERDRQWPTVESLRILDDTALLEAVRGLRRRLSSKDAIRSFVDASKMHVLVDVFLRATSSFLATEVATDGLFLLKESCSALANCCNYSATACLELKPQHIRFTNIALRLLESQKLLADSRVTFLRLIANVCAHKEMAVTIGTSPGLLEKLLQQLETKDPAILRQMFRILKSLLKARMTKNLILANAGYFLGQCLAECEEGMRKDVVQILEPLAHFGRNLGRQMATSDCGAVLLSLVLEEHNTLAKSVVVKLCEQSRDVRDRLSELDVISKVTEVVDQSLLHYSLLAAFAQDAWGRANLRSVGALDALVTRLQRRTGNEERLAITSAFRHFVHDTNGMAHLARNKEFMDTVVADVNDYLTEYVEPCKVEVDEENEYDRPDSPLLIEIECTMRKRRNSTEPERLHKDFCMWGYGSPSSHANSPYGSPQYSPPSSGGVSPVYSSPETPRFDVVSSPGSSAQVATAAVEDALESEKEKLDMDEKRMLRGLVENELFVVCWQAQEDSNLTFLIRDDLVDALLGYMSGAMRADMRLGRALRRMASSRAAVQHLLDMQFHTRVLTTLCATPCRVVRYAKRCTRCEKNAEFGRDVLREFSSHVDSDFGHSFLRPHLNSVDFTERTKAAIALVTLVRDRFHSRRLSNGGETGLEIIFRSLEELMTRDDFKHIAHQSTYPNGAPLCVQLIGALSTLVPMSKFREVFELNSRFIAPQVAVSCVLNVGGFEESETFVFKTLDGEEMARIPMEAVMKNSEYFNGMFRTDLAEKCSGRREFVFDPSVEHCAHDDFLKFLHFVSGCRGPCVAVNSAPTCQALILLYAVFQQLLDLSDRYLCSSLADFVCGAHGPAMRFISGSNLHLLLTTALSTNIHTRLLSACLLTLVRFATPSDVVETLLDVSASHLLTQSFVQSFRAFILSSRNARVLGA